VTTRNAPPAEAGWRQWSTISDFRKEEYFCGNDWTPDSALNPFANFVFPCKRFCAALAPARDAISRKSRSDLPDE
jgi:hypothetical protein